MPISAEWDEDSGTYSEAVDWGRFKIVDKGYGYFKIGRAHV